MTQPRHYRSVVANSARWDGFVFRPNDIVISTPAKCGTTWMQRLVALLVFGGADLPAPISRISPWLDMQLAPLADVVALLDAQTHRRFIKTHTPLDGLPFDRSVTYICVARDPRDVAVSSAHHMSNMDIDRFLAARAEAVGLDDLAEMGITGPGPAPAESPEMRLRAWIEDESDLTVMSLSAIVNHVATFWARRDEPNIALFHYADLKRDLPGQLGRLADVLGISVSDETVQELAAFGTFEAMKADAGQTAPNADISLWRDTNEFFHRGTSGQWREVFGEEDLRSYDARIAALAAPDLAAWLHSGWLAPDASEPTPSAVG